MERTKNNKSGFSMLELLLVLTCIAVISAVIVTGYQKIHEYTNVTTSEIMVDKLNNAVGVWLTLQMRSGQFGKKASDLGADVDRALVALQTAVRVDGKEVDAGLPPKLTVEKIKGMGIKFENGEFKL